MSRISLKNKVTRILTSVSFFIFFSFIVAVFFYIKPKLINVKVTNYQNILSPIANSIQVKLAKYMVLGTSTANNLSLFYNPSINLNLTDQYLNHVAQNILLNHYHIQGVAFAINSQILNLSDKSLESFIDKNMFFSVIWYKDFNQQISKNYFDYKNSINYPDFLEAQNFKAPIFGKIYMFTKGGANTLVQPIDFPIYLGDKFYGIVEFLISLNFITEATKFIEAQQDITLIAFNNDGIILNYSADNYLAGKPITKVFPDNASRIIKLINQKQTLNLKLTDKYFIGQYITLPETNKFWIIGIEVPYSVFSNNIVSTTILLALIGTVLVIIFFFLANMIANNFEHIAQTIVTDAEHLYKGEIDEPIKTAGYFREIEHLTRYLEALRKRLLELTRIHHHITERHYKKSLKPLSHKDRLANSINQALQTIQKRYEERLKLETEKQQTDWVNNGITQIYYATRLENSSLEDLSNRVVETLIKYTKAYIGGLFVLDKKTNKLKSVATFAYEKPKVFSYEIELGQGLIGTVALEKKRRYIRNVPEDYDIIVTGLGEVKPKSIVIQPVIYENELLAVFELAFLRELQDYELEFIDKASNTIAQALKTLFINLETLQLLKQTQKQTQELESVKAQLQKHIKELEQQRKLLRENEIRMKSIVDAINHTLMTAEYTIDGTLITANERFLSTMHFSLDEIVGANVLDLVQTERAELEQVIKQVAQGKYFEKVMKRYTKYGEVKWLYSTYTPYYDTNGKITKILYFAFDITDTYNKIQELEKQIEVLQKQIQMLRNALKTA